MRSLGNMDTEVSAGKSFLTVFRMLFVLLSVYFFIDIFVEKWGGFSYYMGFMDFLPDLSLTYILWTIMVVVLALVVWIIAFCIVKLLPVIRFEHLFGGLLIAVLLAAAKNIFFRIPFLIKLAGLSNIIQLIILLLFVTFIVFAMKNVIGKLLYALDHAISLLVWFFALLIVLAVPLSFIITIDYDSQSIPVDCTKINNSNTNDGINKSASRPNIILVTMDSLTTMDMESYGYDRPTTPFISVWSKDAVVFKNVYSSSMWTPPATLSILTSKRVWTHGVWHRTWMYPVKKFEQNLPKMLKDNGYDLFGFVQTPYVHPVSLGMGESFDIKVMPYSMKTPETWWFKKLSMLLIKRPIAMEMIFQSNAIAKFINKFRPNEYITETPSEPVYDGFLDCISQYKPESKHRPFFAWLHVFPPHYPYLPPKPYSGMFGDSEKLISFDEQENNFCQTFPKELQSNMDILRKRYDEMIVYADSQFELFLSRLSERIDMSNTIIILSSDHGEPFSHGVRGHVSEHLYEDSVRIPLIVKLPEEGKGREINIPVESIDIAPSILKLAGIPVPDWMEGRALLPLREGEEPDPIPIFTMQFNSNLSLGRPLTKGTIAVREKDYKLIYYIESGTKLLFDLGADPYETKDISGDEPLITEHLMEIISDNFSKANAKISESSLSK